MKDQVQSADGPRRAGRCRVGFRARTGSAMPNAIARVQIPPAARGACSTTFCIPSRIIIRGGTSPHAMPSAKAAGAYTLVDVMHYRIAQV